MCDGPRERTGNATECVTCRRQRQRRPRYNLIKRMYRRRLADMRDTAQLERLLNDEAN